MFYLRNFVMVNEMDIVDVIDHFGGLQPTADALNTSKQCVYAWSKTKRIPLIQQCHIEHVSGGKFKADTSALPFELIVQ